MHTLGKFPFEQQFPIEGTSSLALAQSNKDNYIKQSIKGDVKTICIITAGHVDTIAVKSGHYIILDLVAVFINTIFSIK